MPKKESGMWRKKNAPMSKNYRQGGSTYMGGGMTPAKKSAFFKGPKKSGIAEIQEGDLKQVRPGMKKGGKFISPPRIADGKPRRITKKTPQESKVRKKPGMARGGNLNINKRTLAKMTPKQLASDTMSEYFSSKVNESKGRKRGPGMARGGNLTINKKLIAKMTPKQLKSKTMTDYFNSKVSESRKGRKKGPGR